MQNLKKNWPVVWKMKRGIWQIFIRTFESVKIGSYMGSRFTEELCVMTLKNYEKSGEIDLFKNWDKQFNEFWLEHWNVSKIYTLMGCFWLKHIMFEHRKYRRVMFDGIQDWYKVWRKTDLCFQKWHEEFSKLSPEYVRKPKNWDFHWVVLYKVECVWA